MSCCSDIIPNAIQRLEPMIGGDLIADLSPDPLLRVQRRLIHRQIFQSQSSMGLKKRVNGRTPMPLGSVDIQPDDGASEFRINMPQIFHESFCVPFGDTNHPPTPKPGSHPTEDIEPLPMLTGGGNTQSLAPLSPASAHTRMQRKTRFVFKDDDFLGTETTQFFLKPDGTSEHPWLWLANMNRLPASEYIPADASTVGLAVPLSVPQTGVSDEPLTSAHPIEPGLSQTPTAISLNLSLPAYAHLLLIGYAVHSLASILRILTLVYLLPASSDLDSDASILIHRLSILVADPPVSATGPLSLTLSRLQGFPLHRLPDAPESLPDALRIWLGFSYKNINTPRDHCKNIYDVCINNFKRDHAHARGTPLGLSPLRCDEVLQSLPGFFLLTFLPGIEEALVTLPF